MKFLSILLMSMVGNIALSQTLQLHYDFRHTTDPVRNNKNFPTVYFEYFKTLDSGKAGTLLKRYIQATHDTP